MRLTVAQALIRFLSVQYSERDGVEQRLIAGCFGIFGHGNVAGIGQALLEQPDEMPFYHARNEQAMVHTAAALRTPEEPALDAGLHELDRPRRDEPRHRRRAGDDQPSARPAAARRRVRHPRARHRAAGARGPVVLHGLASTTRCARSPSSGTGVERPEQLVPALLAAMRVLTDPAETGAVTLALPQDVQAEAFDWPDELFEKRVWRVRRPLPEPDVLAAGRRADPRRLEAADRRPAAGRSTPRPPTRSPRFAEATGIPVAETQAGKGSLPYDHPQALGAIGATGTTAANAAAREADVILGVGTRWSDFTTASRSLFDGVFINLNVATVDAFKHAGAPARRRRARSGSRR